MLRIILLIGIIIGCTLNAQDFVTIRDNQFRIGDSEFKFFGFNAYYLFTQAAFGKKYVTDDVFDAAAEIGAKVVRTWAFYEADSEENSAVIRPSPYKYNETALQALDYVIFKAKEKNVRLILCLVNANPHYGGISQYLRWGRKYLNRDYSINDFYTSDSLKAWYKESMNFLLNRINTFTSVAYKDEPAIFSFELINEATNPGGNPAAVNNWYKEMASYFKSIDFNHLLTTGESGEDDDKSQYSDVNLFYNSSKFLFNGSKGISYSRNISIPEIDYGSFHLYAEGWGIHPAAGVNWIKEHLFIAESMNKPALLSEFGCRNNKAPAYRKWLKEISTLNCRSAIVWHYIHPDIVNSDSYGFNLNDTAIVNEFRKFAAEIEYPLVEKPVPVTAELFQNYPNPFNPVTTIKYSLDYDDQVLLELYTSTGERVGILDEGFRKKGTYELLLSFNSVIYASGPYFYTLRTSKETITRKLLLLK
jgi:mannan endo-1,4-beta-mannosidase